MEIPKGLKYTRDHEWLKVEGDEGTVGITEFAQGELGDIVFLDLPDVGTEVKQDVPFGAIEAVKAAADLYAPISGEIVAINGLLDQSPELINKSPYGDGWIVKIKITEKDEIDTLLDAAAYAELIKK